LTNVLGHPVHPALVHFPIGLLLSATIADLAWVAGLTHDTHIAAILMAGGLAGGLLAMVAGMVDLIRLDQKLVGHATVHMSVVGLAWIGYAVALYLRKDALTGSAPIATPTVAVSIVSAIILAAGGWLGGRLVYTFGANVEPARSPTPD
jgi:uncharacterized membrane protein